MKKKMTISEFKNFIQEQALRMFIAHILKEQDENELEEDFGQQFSNPNCMEQPEICMSQPEQIMDPRPEL